MIIKIADAKYDSGVHVSVQMTPVSSTWKYSGHTFPMCLQLVQIFVTYQ